MCLAQTFGFCFQITTQKLQSPHVYFIQNGNSTELAKIFSPHSSFIFLIEVVLLPLSFLMYTHINKNNPITNLWPNPHKHTNTNEYNINPRVPKDVQIKTHKYLNKKPQIQTLLNVQSYKHKPTDAQIKSEPHTTNLNPQQLPTSQIQTHHNHTTNLVECVVFITKKKGRSIGVRNQKEKKKEEKKERRKEGSCGEKLAEVRKKESKGKRKKEIKKEMLVGVRS